MFTNTNTSQTGKVFTCNMFQPGKIELDQGRENGNLATWSGLTENPISKYLAKSESSTFGNLDPRQKNIRSTKSEHLALDVEKYFSLQERKPQIWYFLLLA